MLLTQEYKSDWSISSKILFRILLVYFMGYLFLMFFSSLLETPFRWIGTHILGIDYDYDVSGYGSGDHTYAYISLFINVLLTLAIVPVWSILDRKRGNYNILFYWFLVLLRITLVAFMFMYGWVKIFQIQFPEPSLTRLLEPLGNFSPMGLAWTYMGFSEGFNMFTGFMEILGGLLLIPRRTQTLGSFIVIGVMTHVAVMNFMFDIPVKLFSVHLVAMAAVIFMTDIERFIGVFFLNKTINTYNYFHPIDNQSYHKISARLKAVILVLLVIVICFFGYTTERSSGSKRTKPNLYGIWKTSTVIKNGDTIPPLTTDIERWKYLIIERKDRAVIKTMDDAKHYYSFIPDTLAKTVKIYKNKAKTDDDNFSYSYPNPEVLQLEGIIEKDTLQIMFFRKNLDDFILKSRGFHWINERPYNR